MSRRKAPLSIVDGSEISATAAKRYVSHTYEMLNSPAWLCLPDNARRLVSRIELQHVHLACCKNGDLIVTWDQFERDAGIPRGAIRLATVQAEALGWIEVMRRGGSTAGGERYASRYRLTAVKNLGKDAPEPTDEWRAIETVAAAQAALRQAERDLDTERAAKLARRAARKAA